MSTSAAPASVRPKQPRYRVRQRVRVKHRQLAGVLLEVQLVSLHAGETGREPTYELREVHPPHTVYDDVEESDIGPGPDVVAVSQQPSAISPNESEIFDVPGLGSRNVTVAERPQAVDVTGPDVTGPDVTGPGWLYDAHSGFELGPASYEQRAEFEAHVRTTAKTHMTFHNLAGCKRDVLLEPARRALPRPQPPRARRA